MPKVRNAKDTPTQEIDVPQELLELCTEDRTTLDDEVSRDVIEECCKLLLMQGFLQRDEYEKMTCHRARRDRFCQLVSRDENAYRCLCQVLIRRREKTLLSKYVNKWETFVKSSNYLAQIDAVIALDAAIYKRNISVSALIESCQNGSQEIDGRRKKVTTTVIAGSAVSIASSVMVIVGIALAPVSFGASLGLSITGGIIGFGSGATVGTARAIEGVKQNTKLNEIRTIFDLMQERENEVKTALSKAQDCFNLSFQGGQDNGQKYPGKSLRGFLAVCLAFRASHSVIGIILTSARLSASAAAVSASILGPLSLVFDLAFLAEATNNKVKGDRTNAGELLQEKAESANLKCNIFNSLLRGSHGEEKRLIDWN